MYWSHAAVFLGFLTLTVFGVEGVGECWIAMLCDGGKTPTWVELPTGSSEQSCIADAAQADELDALSDRIVSLTTAADLLMQEVQALKTKRKESTISDQSTKPTPPEKGPCSIPYGGRCYWIIMEDGMDYPAAVQTCKQHGGSPANIYDAKQYDMIMNSSCPSSTPACNTYLWLGLKIDVKEHKTTLSDGTAGAYTEWYRSPLYRPTFTHVFLAITRDNKGMVDTNPESEMKGVVCEK